VNIPAKVDYAMRALLELAEHDVPVAGERLASLQAISPKFLFAILNDLRRAGLVVNLRGADGGYRLRRPASEITVADVIRAVDGPVAAVRGQAPESVEYEGAATNLKLVWVATRAGLLEVLDAVSLADILEGAFAESVSRLVSSPRAWMPESGPYDRPPEVAVGDGRPLS
jgi:Rrf2 family protein